MKCEYNNGTLYLEHPDHEEIEIDRETFDEMMNDLMDVEEGECFGLYLDYLGLTYDFSASMGNDLHFVHWPSWHDEKKHVSITLVPKPGRGNAIDIPFGTLVDPELKRGNKNEK
jgi:hypothetical protein